MEKQNNSLAVSVVTRSAQRVIGMVVRTSMATALIDCPKLWSETFGPRIHELECGGESYGISWMVQDTDQTAQSAGAGTDDCVFDYWAALPAREDAPIPDGMRECYLPEGHYAECHVASLQGLAAAYNYIYGTWLPGQNEYTVDMRGASYELYPADYLRTGRIILYCAVKPL
ncbi:GyrI-like domain-containing protein [Desulfovibrio sp. OttesenSCG-928-I05]|nr:GyrI-like domain-containing protein [Desulfovibrio sp. OttesenSCG-928-I05]